MNRSKRYCVHLSGASFFYVVYLLLRQRKVYILSVDFSFRPTRPFFMGLFNWLKRRCIFKDIFDEIQGLRHFRDITSYADRRDLYYKAEQVLDQYFNTARTDEKFSDYSSAIKHITCNYVRRWSLLPFVLNHIRKCRSLSDFQIIGLESDIGVMYEGYFGERLFPAVKVRKNLRIFINFFQGLLILIYGLSWVLSRIRLTNRAKKSYYLGVDYTHDRDLRGLQLVKEITDPDKEIIFFFRNKKLEYQYKKSLDSCDWRTVGDGTFCLSQGLISLLQIFFDTVKLSACFIGVESDKFFQITLLPYRRMVFRVLVQSNPVKFFLCRDDYNSEHSLRSQELRRAGSQSLSVMHGVPYENIIEPSLRYIDYDFYYIFGEHIYETYYKERWSKEMTVRAIGPWGMGRIELARLAEPRPKDLIYFSRSGPREGMIMTTLRQLAALYPNRKFYIKLKQGIERYTEVDLENYENLPSNMIMVPSEENSYEWMLQAQFAAGSATTAVFEAITYGLKPLVFDLHENWSFYPREFPELGLIRTPEEGVARYQALESGEIVFNRHQFCGLTETRVENPFDIIRRDLGLEEKGLPGLDIGCTSG